MEDWLRQVEEVMLKSVKEIVEKSLQDYTKKDREKCKNSYFVINWGRGYELARAGGVSGGYDFLDELG